MNVLHRIRSLFGGGSFRPPGALTAEKTTLQIKTGKLITIEGCYFVVVGVQASGGIVILKSMSPEQIEAALRNDIKAGSILKKGG